MDINTEDKSDLSINTSIMEMDKINDVLALR